MIASNYFEIVSMLGVFADAKIRRLKVVDTFKDFFIIY